MGSIIQNKNGRLIDIENIKRISDSIQLVQLSNGYLKDILELKKGDKLISFTNKINCTTVSSIKNKKCKKFVFLKLKNGFFIIVPENFELVTTINADILCKKVSDLEVNDFVATPGIFKTTSKNITFDPWYFDDFLYVVGVKKWYLRELNKILKKRDILLKDIAKELEVEYWLVRRNPSSKDSISYGYLKKFIKKYLDENKIYKIFNYSKGLKNEKSAKKFAKIPFEYNDDLAYLNAVMVAEGHIVKNEKQAILEFSDKNYTNVLKDMYFNVHGYQQNGTRINLPGFLAYFYHRFLGVPKGNKSKIVEFPQLALLSKNKIMLNALRGVIDGEGNVSATNYSITITSNSFKFILGLSSALLRIGVSSSIRKSKKDNTWILSVSRGNIGRLIKNIKCLKHRKKNEEMLKLKKMNFTERRIIPNVGSYLRNLRKKLNIPAKQLASDTGLSNIYSMEKSGNFSYETLIKLNTVLKDNKIDKLLKTKLNWCKIIYKKEIRINNSFIFPITTGFFLLNNILVRYRKKGGV